MYLSFSAFFIIAAGEGESQCLPYWPILHFFVRILPAGSKNSFSGFLRRPGYEPTELEYFLFFRAINQGFGGRRGEKKQTIIEKLKIFFERFFGIG